MHLLLYVFQLETIFDVCMSFSKIVLECIILKWKSKGGGGVYLRLWNLNHSFVSEKAQIHLKSNLL